MSPGEQLYSAVPSNHVARWWQLDDATQRRWNEVASAARRLWGGCACAGLFAGLSDVFGITITPEEHPIALQAVLVGRRVFGGERTSDALRGVAAHLRTVSGVLVGLAWKAVEP